MCECWWHYLAQHSLWAQLHDGPLKKRTQDPAMNYRACGRNIWFCSHYQNTLVNQPMMQRRPNPTEVRSMDPYMYPNFM